MPALALGIVLVFVARGSKTPSPQNKGEAVMTDWKAEFAEADHSLDDEIDDAYKEKYGYPSSAVDHITNPEARATTLRLIPH